MNRVRPRSGSALLVPQPEAASAIAARAARSEQGGGSGSVAWASVGGAAKRAGVYMSGTLESAGWDRPSSGRLEAIRTKLCELEKGSVQMQVREGMSEVVLTRRALAHAARGGAAKMVEKGTGAALVVDDEMPVPSIVTERDILHSVGDGEDPDAERVSDHMSEGVVAASPDWSLERAAAEMSTPRRPPLGRLRGGRAGRRPLDPRHCQRLDQRRRHVGDDARLNGAQAVRSAAPAERCARPEGPRRGLCCLRGSR